MATENAEVGAVGGRTSEKAPSDHSGLFGNESAPGSADSLDLFPPPVPSADNAQATTGNVCAFF